MKLKKRVFSGSALLLAMSLGLLSACAAVDEGSNLIEPGYKLEELLTARQSGDQLEIGVVSTGCTRPEDFVVHYEAVEGLCEASIYRTKRDLCRRRPFTLSVQLPFSPPQACEGKALKIINAVKQTAVDR